MLRRRLPEIPLRRHPRNCFIHGACCIFIHGLKLREVVALIAIPFQRSRAPLGATAVTPRLTRRALTSTHILGELQMVDPTRVLSSSER